jgi:hypothetical protein
MRSPLLRRNVAPLLLLDIDGVICVFGGANGGDYVLVDGVPRRLADNVAANLQQLAQRFHLVWASSWGAEANGELAPLLGLPPLPHVAWETETGEAEHLKLADVARFVGVRPCAWLDDDLDETCATWAAERSAPTLLVPVDPQTGLTMKRVGDLLAFAAEQTADEDE